MSPLEQKTTVKWASVPVPVQPLKPKTGWNVLSCLIWALVVLLAVVAGLAIAVAKTGLMQVPLASRLYHGPTPARVITAGVMTTEEFYDRLSLKLVTAVRRGENPPFRVTLDETELTAGLRGALAGVIRGSSLVAERPQIAVTPRDLEFSGRFKQGILTLDLLIRLKPAVRERRLSLEPERFELGDFSLPTSTVVTLAGSLFSRDFGSWSLDVGKMSLTDVVLKDGKVELLLAPK